MANKDKLYNKRYKTLKEHRAAVKARKLLEGGNKGPVANADAYGSTLKKKPAPKPAPKPPSKPPTSSSKPPAKPPRSTPTGTNRERASSRFYSSSSGTYGENMPSNPKLKSQPKKKKKQGPRAGERANVTRKPPAPKPKRRTSAYERNRRRQRRLR